MGKIQKVVVDTNVIISAFGWGGKPLQIMELLERGEMRNCVSEHTLKELIAALAYPKLAFSHATQTNMDIIAARLKLAREHAEGADHE